jgi:hypothetical protein
MRKFRFNLSKSQVLRSLSKLLALFCVVPLASSLPATAAPLRGTLERLADTNSKQSLFLSIETKEGVHTFSFRPDPSQSDTESERHYIGASMRRSLDATSAKASLSIFGDMGFLYFSSRRRGRPHSMQFSFSKNAEGLELGPAILASAPLVSINCAVGAQSAVSTSPHVSHTSTREWGRMQPVRPLRVLEVDVEADYEFFRRFGPQTRNYIRSALRAADTLYTADLGIRIKPISLRVTNQGSAQVSIATAENVLESFRRQPRRGRLAADVHHLFTGKHLDGNTIGLAYVGTACMEQGRFNVGISQAVSRALQPVLVAHEIGHNLSAVHDTGKRSVMNPAPRGVTVSFTQAAREDIQSYLETAGGCLEPERNMRAELCLSPVMPSPACSTLNYLKYK